MKIEAGWKLCQRKPSAAPAVSAASTPGGVPVERERDHRERGRRDRAHARRQPVGAVGEVHDVHHRDHPHQREHGAPVAELERLHERQRQVGRPSPRASHRDRAAPNWPSSFTTAAARRAASRRAPRPARWPPPRPGSRGWSRGRPAGTGARDHEHGQRGSPARPDRARRASWRSRSRGWLSTPRRRASRGGGGSGHEGDDCRDEERPEGIELVHSARSLLGRQTARAPAGRAPEQLRPRRRRAAGTAGSAPPARGCAPRARPASRPGSRR